MLRVRVRVCVCQDTFKDDDDSSPVWIKMHLMNIIASFRNLYVSTAAAAGAVCIVVIVVCLKYSFVLSFRFVFHTCIVYVSECVRFECVCYPCVSVSSRLSLWQVILYCSSNCWLPVSPFPACLWARCWQKPAFVIWSRYTRICDRLKTILTFSHSLSLSLALS